MDELTKQLSALATQFGPSVYNAAVDAARVEGYSVLVGGVLYLVGAVALAIFGWMLIKESNKKMDHEWWAFPGGSMLVAGVVLGIAGVLTLADPWTWATINHPELWLAKQALHL